LRETIASDPSYYVVAEALRALAAIEEGAAGGELLRALGRDSHLDVVRIAAMRALGSLAEKDKLSEAEHAALIDRLLEYSLRRFPVWTRGAAMGTLASIGSGNEKVFETISSALDDDLLNARMAAVRALGGLGDERAIELLERRRGLEAHRPFRDPIDTIDQAIRNIRSARSGSPVDDRLDQVEKSQQELERRIEELEKRGAEI
jgi:HEAT repeat protein